MTPARVSQAALLALALVALALGGLLRLGDLGAGPPRPLFEDELAGQPEVVVLGSSIAAASVDAEALGAALGLRGASLALQGSEAAHWAALVEHRLRRAGRHPALIVLYTPLQAVERGPLLDPRDRALLPELLLTPDRALLEKALGHAGLPTWRERLLRGRLRVREAALRAVSRGPARVAWGDDAVEQAAEALVSTPADPAARPGVVPGAPTPGAPVKQPPPPVPLAEGFVPDLAAAAAAMGARLVVVEPARREDRPAGCAMDPPTAARVDGLRALGVEVLDLSPLALEPARFTTRYHLDPEGRAALTAPLAEGLRQLEGGYRRWGC